MSSQPLSQSREMLLSSRDEVQKSRNSTLRSVKADDLLGKDEEGKKRRERLKLKLGQAKSASSADMDGDGGDTMAKNEAYPAVADVKIGDRVRATLEGADVQATVIERTGMRLHLRMQDGKTTFADIKDVTEVIEVDPAATFFDQFQDTMDVEDSLVGVPGVRGSIRWHLAGDHDWVQGEPEDRQGWHGKLYDRRRRVEEFRTFQDQTLLADTSMSVASLHAPATDGAVVRARGDNSFPVVVTPSRRAFRDNEDLHQTVDGQNVVFSENPDFDKRLRAVDATLRVPADQKVNRLLHVRLTFAPAAFLILGDSCLAVLALVRVPEGDAALRFLLLSLLRVFWGPVIQRRPRTGRRQGRVGVGTMHSSAPAFAGGGGLTFLRLRHMLQARRSRRRRGLVAWRGRGPLQCGHAPIHPQSR